MNSAIKRTGVIEAPPRGSFAGNAIILLVVGVISVAPVLPRSFGMVSLFTLLLLLSAAIIKRQAFAVHLSLLFALLFMTYLPGPSLHTWPLKTLVPLLIYGLIVLVVPSLRRSTNWIKMGELDAKMMRLVIAIAILSAVALVGWVVLLKPDIQDHINNIPDLPLAAYPIAGIGFAVLNAAMEEAVFRGVVMEAVDSAIGPGSWSVVLHAAPFAAFHYQAGFPKGTSGFAMTFVYGIMLGALRRVSRGMLAPLLAHILADMTIFLILIFFYFDK